jgi:hypothetical protein
VPGPPPRTPARWGGLRGAAADGETARSTLRPAEVLKRLLPAQSRPGRGWFQMSLLAYPICLDEPRPEFVIDVRDVVKPETVHVIPRRVRLDLHEPPTLEASSQDQMAIEPTPARRDLRK